MKKIAFGNTIVILALFFASCSKDKVAVLTPPDEVEDPEITGDTYFGKIGTQRYYTMTQRWLQQGTTKPFVAVPDSLRHRVALSDSQLSAGVCMLWDLCETVDPLDSFYTNLYPLPLSRYKRVGDAKGVRYELLDELDALEHGLAYSPHVAQISYDLVIRELPDVDWTVHFKAQERQFPQMPYMKKPLTVGSSWTRFRAMDPVTNQVNEDMIVDIVGKVEVTVPAGTFEAYKLAMTFLSCYEYYVPNIGLVLRESDIYECQWNSQTRTTICFRDVTRMELTSYNVIR